jgi:hypothetical protein
MTFDLMVSMAAVEYPVIVDGGVVFLGYDTVLVPTAVSKKGDAAQFHLITHPGTQYAGNGHDRMASGTRGQLNPYKVDLGKRMNTTDAQQFRSMRCFLGWCEVAHVNLGTKHLPARVHYSGGRETPRSLALDGYDAMMQLSAGGIGPLSATLGLQANFQYMTHRRQFTPFGGFSSLLRSTASDLAVLYDASQQRGWLVPKLSLLLHMCHAYALSCADNPVDNVPFVPSHADAAELISQLESLGERSVLGSHKSTDGNGCENNKAALVSPETTLLFRQLLLGLNSNLLSTVAATQPSEGKHLHAFEFMDVVTTPGRGSCMRKLDLLPGGRAWVDVVNAVDCVVVCADIGNVITPAALANILSPRRSRKCDVLPQKQDCLAATVPCLARLAHRKGLKGGSLLLDAAVDIGSNGNTNEDLKDTSFSPRVEVSDETFWGLRGDPFRACQHDGSETHSCWERKDLFQKLKTAPERRIQMRLSIRRERGPPVRSSVEIPLYGAVVFR